MKFENDLTRMLGIRHPLVMAPMFLISNEAMLRAAMNSGILGCFPSLNYRDSSALNDLLERLNEYRNSNSQLSGSYGVNLIVQKSNFRFSEHLKICVQNKVPVYITSLGNPAETIQAAHSYGAKVFCDVTNLKHAEKCASLDCDGFIAVGQGAGGHAGPYPVSLLIRTLRKHFPDQPVLAAGGISDGYGILSVLAAGASAAYCGTRFIASSESGVSKDYINAIIDAGMEDIVMTDRISGTPCTVINTPFAQKIGLRQNRFERWLGSNPKTKKYYKLLVQRRGFNWLEKAMTPGTYTSLWCAGQSVELIDGVQSVREITDRMIQELETAYTELHRMVRPD
jgi:nitronate monooxygenase